MCVYFYVNVYIIESPAYHEDAYLAGLPEQARRPGGQDPPRCPRGQPYWFHWFINNAYLLCASLPLLFLIGSLMSPGLSKLLHRWNHNGCCHLAAGAVSLWTHSGHWNHGRHVRKAAQLESADANLFDVPGIVIDPVCLRLFVFIFDSICLFLLSNFYFIFTCL